MSDQSLSTPAKAGLGALTLGALGVVFGDIGTSPLYALRAVFSPESPHLIEANNTSVYGIVSLIFWAITIIVSVKYVTFIMRANNEGEGGIMALIALIRRYSGGQRATLALIALGVVGASLFYGDGMITPAISVLSAVEGLETVSPTLVDLIIPITVAIITGLFVIQRFGTGAVGRLFGPVMGLWFAALAALGLGRVIGDPGILVALSPHYAILFFVEHSLLAFFALASVVLVVTGAEALYADMGHFGRSPIKRAWFFLVFPALTLNYLGQASLLLERSSAIGNPFFLLVPEWGRIPMVILACFATVIASQAVISGAFSVTRQAIQLGFVPRLTVRHTSNHEVGQVYVPVVNWGLFVAVVALVIGFGSSEHLASAYGIAVTGTLVIDTILFFVVAKRMWHRPTWMVATGLISFLLIDVAFFSANLSKLLHGGWFPLVIAAAIFTLLMTWQRGRVIVTRNRVKEEGPLMEFVEQMHRVDPPPYRTPGTGVFLNADKDTTPLALRANFKHNHVLHETVIILTIENLPVPHVPEDERVSIDDLGDPYDGMSFVVARYGFQDIIDAPQAIRLAVDVGLEPGCDLEHVSYFLSKMTLVQTAEPGMVGWRKRLFMAISRNAASPIQYFGIPDDQVVTMGSHVEL